MNVTLEGSPPPRTEDSESMVRRRGSHRWRRASVALAAVVALAVPVAAAPAAQATHPGQPRHPGSLYVASQGDDPSGSTGSLSVINPMAFAEVRRQPTEWNSNTVAVAPRHHRVYVTQPSQDQVSVYDTRTWQRVATMPAPGWANGVVVSRDEKRAYVSSFHSGQVHAYDLRRNELVTSVTLPNDPEPVKVRLAHGRLYVAGSRDAQVHVLDAATLRYFGAIPIVSDMLGTRGIDIDRHGRYLYALSREGTIVTAVRLRDWAVVSSRTIATSDGDVNTGRDGIVALHGKVYSTVGSGTYVQVLSTARLHLRRQLALPTSCVYPADMTSDGHHRLYVSCNYSNSVVEVDVRTGATRVAPVGPAPVGLAFG